jgi:phage host-nuclease inhibitor protein Gam
MVRIKNGASVSVPQNQAQARESMLAIGTAQNKRKQIEADMNDAIQKVRDVYNEKAAPHADLIEMLSSGLQTYCEANRDKLTGNGKKKSADIGAGEIGWRVTPPKIACRKLIDIIAAITGKRLGKKYLRRKIEINKDAILEDCQKQGDQWALPEKLQCIAGLSVKSKEEFYIKPHETELEEVA